MTPTTKPHPFKVGDRVMRWDANGRPTPAYQNAPPRLRQSQIERPAQTTPPSWLARLLGRG